MPARMTTWSSRSARARSRPGSAPYSAGPAAATAAAGLLTVGGLRLDPDGHEATLDDAPLDLSRREFDLLHYLVLRAGQVVTRRDLLTHVWRLPYGGADKTVDVHVSWLRRKLGETAQHPRYLHTVRGVGIKLQPARMRLRISLLVVATSSLVLVSFLVPLALVLRTLAADRAISAATAEAQSWPRWSRRWRPTACGLPWTR